jgi:hypothetical protein
VLRGLKEVSEEKFGGAIMLVKISTSGKLRALSMYIHRLFIVLATAGLAISLIGCEPRYAITTSQTSLKLGDGTVDVVLHEAASPGMTYFNLHDNENTCVLAALDVIGEYGGRVIELKHSGDRNITFQLGGSTYEFDPNRMFTENGRVATLERFGNVSNEAIAAVGAFANEVLQQLNPADLDVLVTLHNTDSSYSIFYYTPGGKYEDEAELVYVSEEMDPNDFYFVTDRDVYDRLIQMEQNVILQDNMNATDDGSLSVWSAQQKLVYVNVEAQNGHRRVQAGMIQRLHELFFAD